ncbi:MAG: glycosyltransferase [candidate division Zixibacteria bacterium]|nr:glycosyltransferase [candidate division Zixibacteria bacterium]
MTSSREIKVGVVASTLAVGGAERQLATLARGLRGRCYEFNFFLLRGVGTVGAELARDGFNVEGNIMSRPARWFGVVSELSKHDLLAALDHNNVLTFLAALGRRLPPYVVLYHLQDEPPRRWLRALRRACAVVAVAQSQVSLLRSLDEGSLEVIANGVPLPPAVTPGGRRQAREGLRLPADAVVAAAASRLSPEKGVDLLLEATALIEEDARPLLVVAGDGPERRRLEKFARACLGGCIFLGELADVSRLYRAADLFVLPSYRESAPLALLEAMAHGLPAVAASVGDVPVMLSGGGGVTFTPGSAAELAAGIETLTTEAAARAAMGASARAAVARRYGVERMLDEYDALFKRVTAEGKRNAGDE